VLRVERVVFRVAEKLNWAAALSVTAMMLLTTADVILRIFRHPITGTYEIVGFLGSVFIAFSLAWTSVRKGHIAVEFLIQKFSDRTQEIIESITRLVCLFLFLFLTYHCFLYAWDLKGAGEVSLTLQIPVYPFVFGIAIGCGLFSAVIALQFASLVIRLKEHLPVEDTREG